MPSISDLTYPIPSLTCLGFLIRNSNPNLTLSMCRNSSAYHGHTSLLLELSSYKMKEMNKLCDKDFVHVVGTPDPYRGKYHGYSEETGIKYAEEVKNTIENAHRKGRKVSNGPPPSYQTQKLLFVPFFRDLFYLDCCFSGRVSPRLWRADILSRRFPKTVV